MVRRGSFATISVFLAKNQLASDEPDIVQHVVIPALKPTLDHSLTEDMTLPQWSSKILS